jgi:hypothetical protein
MIADELDCVELAAYILNMGDKYEDWSDVWDKLYDEHGIDDGGFKWLINKLLPLIKVGGLLPNEKMYKGFAKHIGGDLGVYLAKTDYGMTLEEFRKRIAYDWAFEQVKDREVGMEFEVTKDKNERIKITIEKVEVTEE